MRIELPENLDKVDSASSGEVKVLPPGWYAARIKNVEVKINRDKQGKHLLFTLEVIEEGDFEGTPLWDRAGLTADNLPYLKARLEAAGAEWDGSEFDTEQLYGSEIEVRVTNGVYNDKPNNEVKAWRSLE